MEYDVCIVGGGAAGLMCASQIEYGRVIIIDKNNRLGKKLFVSGGGKCNITNRNVSVDKYYSKNKRRVSDILDNWTFNDVIDFLENYEIKYNELSTGQIFLERSRDIIMPLLMKIKERKSKIVLLQTVTLVYKKDDLFYIEMSNGKRHVAKNVIIATGGKAYQELGSTEFGLSVAKQFRLKLIQNQPALTGLKYTKDVKFLSMLAGVSLPVKIKLRRREFEGSLLFAHFGITGPVVYNTSLYVENGDILNIDLVPDRDLTKLPKRVIKAFMQKFKVEKDEDVLEKLCNFSFPYTKTFGYDKAEVMRGGIDVGWLNDNLEHNRTKGLYFIGEVLDITGELGGYNIHNAFATAKLVADVMNRILAPAEEETYSLCQF